MYTIYIYIYNIYIHSKISLNRLTIEPTLNGPHMEVVGLELEYRCNGITRVILTDPNKVINIGE